jgi:hypothetical protein
VVESTREGASVGHELECPSSDPNLQWAVEQVMAALHGLQFGLITLTVQDRVVVQVERTERKRYQRAGPAR